MKKIGLVSVTMNAAAPMTTYFQTHAPELAVVNYLDAQILGNVKRDGGITASSMRRMFDMLATACEDGADALLLTCTIFSPYAELFSQLLARPVICPDRAMLEAVAQREGRTAILCTFSGTVDITREQYFLCRRKFGRAETVDMIVVDGALDALDRGDFAAFDDLIRQKARALDGVYDNLVFAQISMARAADGLTLNHAALFTSPDSACRALMDALEA